MHSRQTIKENGRHAPPPHFWIPQRHLRGSRSWHTIALLLIAPLLSRAEEAKPVSPAPQREIWIPQNDLPSILEKNPKAVVLTAEEYKKLIKESTKPVEKPKVEPPARALIRSANYSAHLSGNAVIAEATFEVECLNPDAAVWQELNLPLDLKTAANIKLDNQSALRFLPAAAPDSQPSTPNSQLLLKGPGRHTLTATLYLPINDTPSGSSISLPSPETPTAAFILELPERYTLRSSQPASKVKSPNGNFIHTISIGVSPNASKAGEPISIHWRAKDIAPLAGGAVLQTCSYLYEIDPTRVSSDLGIVLRSALARVPKAIKIPLPPGAKVLTVEGPDVSQWTQEGDTISLTFASDSLRETTLHMMLETATVTGKDSLISATLPLPAVEGVHRASGNFAIVASPEVRVRQIDTAGLAAQTTADLPGNASSLPGFVAGFAFPVMTAPPTVQLQKLAPRFQADQLTHIQLERDRISLQRTIRLLVKEGELFTSTLKLPAGEEVISLKLADGTEPDWKLVSPGTITLNWPQRVTAKAPGSIELETRIDPEGWFTLGEKSRPLSFGTATILSDAQLGPELTTGYLSLDFDERFHVSTTATTGLDSTDPVRLAANGIPLTGKMTWSRSDTFTLDLAVSRRPSEIHANLTAYALPLLHTCDIEGQIELDVRNSGVRSLLVSAPPGSAASLRFDSPLISEKKLQPLTGEWTLTFHEELTGHPVLRYHWSLPFEEQKAPAGDAAPGKGASPRFSLALPVLKLPEAGRVTGTLVIEANTDTELTLTPQGMDARDTLVLPTIEDYAPRHRVIAAYGWRGTAWNLALEGVRHPSAALPGLVIDDLQISSLLSDDGTERRQLLFQLRSNGEQFFQCPLPEAADILTLTLDGEPIKPVADPTLRAQNQNWLRIQLPATIDARPATIQLTYSLPAEPWDASGSLKLTPPQINPSIPILKANWQLHLPDGYTYKDFDGNLTKQFAQPAPSLAGNAVEQLSKLKLSLPKFSSPSKEEEVVDFLPGGGGGEGKASPARRLPEASETTEGFALRTPNKSATRRDIMNKVPESRVNGNAILEVKPPSVVDTLSSIEEAKSTTPAVPAAAPMEAPADSFAGPAPVLELATKAKTSSLDGKNAGLIPLEISLPTTGQRFSFAGNHLPGIITVSYTSWEREMKIAWLYILAGVFGAWLLAKKHPIFIGLLGALPLHFLPGILGAEFQRPCNGLLLGWSLACVVLLLKLKLFRRPRLTTTAVAMLAVICCFGMTPPASAQETTPTPYTAFVPFDPAKPVSEQTPGRYFLPYEMFQALWAQARENKVNAGKPAIADDASAPAWAAIQTALYSARIEGSRLLIDATLTLQSSGTWASVDLGFAGANLGALSLDNSPAPLKDGKLLVEKPGAHVIVAKLEIPLPPNWQSVNCALPRAAASLLALTTTEMSARLKVNDGLPLMETSAVNTVPTRTITAALGATDHLKIERSLAATMASAIDKLPTSASIVSALYLSPAFERLESTIDYQFPGTDRRDFTLDLDASLTPLSLDIPNLETWNLTVAGERKILTFRLALPVRDSLTVRLTAERATATGDKETFPVLQPSATRLDRRQLLLAVDELEIKPAPTANQLQTNFPDLKGADAGFQRVASFSSTGMGEPLHYGIVRRVLLPNVTADYLYQISPSRLEIHALLGLQPARGADLLSATALIPAGFTVTRVDSDRLQDWWVEDGKLRIRFSGATPEQTTLLLGLAQSWKEPPAMLQIAPIQLENVAKVKGRAQLASLPDVNAKISFAEKVATIREVGFGEKAADYPQLGQFKLTTPYEAKREFTFDTATFAAAVTLERVPAKFDTRFVLAAAIQESWTRVEARCDFEVKAGALSEVVVTLPAAVTNEPQITGSEVREVSKLADPPNSYKVALQRPIVSATQFTISMELPHNGEIRLPDLSFPGTGQIERYLIVQNASDGELHVETARSAHVEPLQQRDIDQNLHFKLDNFTQPLYFRAGSGWDLLLTLEKLAATTGTKALVLYAELTSAIRPNGEQWLKADYRLQNRTLQFLPVRLPKDYELLSAMVSGSAVRADMGQRDNQPVLLIPLIQTRPGDMALDVQLVCRKLPTGELPSKTSLDFDDPELPGVSIERTVWRVAVPDGYEIKDSRGNMEKVEIEATTREKQDSLVNEISSLISISKSKDNNLETRQNAASNAVKLITSNGIDGLMPQAEELKNNEELQVTPSDPFAPSPNPNVQAFSRNDDQWSWKENSSYLKQRETQIEDSRKKEITLNKNNLGLNDNVISGNTVLNRKYNPQAKSAKEGELKDSKHEAAPNLRNNQINKLQKADKADDQVVQEQLKTLEVQRATSQQLSNTNALSDLKAAESAAASANNSVDFSLNYQNGVARGNLLDSDAQAQHLKNLEETSRLIKVGLGHYDLGQFEKAEEAFNKVLAIDPTNQSARLLLERTEREIETYLLAARDHTRSHVLRQADENGETAVPQKVARLEKARSAAMLTKLNNIFLTRLNFEDAPIEEVISYLHSKSVELDVVDPDKTGVNFILQTKGRPIGAITLDLRGVPLILALDQITAQAGLSYRVESHAVVITSTAEAGQRLESRVFDVASTFLSAAGAGVSAVPETPADPFAAPPANGTGEQAPAMLSRPSAQQVLNALGANFEAPAASATFLPGTNKLVVKNTPAQLDLIETLINGRVEAKDKPSGLQQKLRPAGRASLPIDFPVSGTLQAFRKVKDQATLTLTVEKTGNNLPDKLRSAAWLGSSMLLLLVLRAVYMNRRRLRPA